MINWPWKNKHAKSEGPSSDASLLEQRMRQAEARIMGIHQITKSKSELQEFAEDEANTGLTLDYLEELYERLYLVDIWLSDMGIGPNVLMEADLDGQAPYNEMYFDESGTERLFPEQHFMPSPPSEESGPCRIRFFLHYVDLRTPLDILGKKISFPAVQPLPDWLKEAMPYQPPN